MLTLSPLSLMMLLLTLPATASAFLHSTTISRPRVNNVSRNKIVIQSSNDQNNALDISFETSCPISLLLREKQKELLLVDPANILKQHPQSTVAADNERESLTTEQMVREAILSARLPLPLHRTRVGPSTIEGAGRGLFAAENIAKGEVITCYPGDALLYELPSSLDENDDDDEEEDEWTEEIVLWGAHVPTNDRWDEDAVFDGTPSHPIPLTDYVISVDDHYSVMGHPDLDDNQAYHGHYANDGAGYLALEKGNPILGLDEESMGVEGTIAAYVLKSFEIANASHRPLEGGLHMATVALRDVEEGEEILVTYGPDYWLGYS